MPTILLVVLIFLLLCVFAWMSLAPWVPTRKKEFERINAIADLKPG
jgi:preprotein translocase subunit YajC